MGRFAFVLALASGLPGVVHAQTADAARASAAFAEGLMAEGAGREGAALSAYREAVAHGFVPAMARLGVLLETGAAGPVDPAEALRLYERAADAGDVDGKFELARTLVEGRIVRRDLPRALRLLAEAGEAGDQQAQLFVALMLENGSGGTQNSFAARRWLQRAASGPHRDIAQEAARIRDQLDEDLLYSRAFSRETTALLYGAGFLVALGLLASDAQPDTFSPRAADLDRQQRRRSCLLQNAGRARTLGDLVMLDAICP